MCKYQIIDKMKVSDQIYKIIAKQCIAFICDKNNIPKEEWNSDEWIQSQDLRDYKIVYDFLLDKHVIKTHIYASSIVLKSTPKSIGMSLDSDGCSKYVRSQLKEL